VADTLVTDMGVPDVLVTDTEAKQCSPTDCDLTCSCTDLIPRASISLMVEAGSKVEAGTVVEARTVVEAGTIVEARTVVEAGTTGVEAGTAEVGSIKVRDFKIRASKVRDVKVEFKILKKPGVVRKAEASEKVRVAEKAGLPKNV
jgi:hypothetical protein